VCRPFAPPRQWLEPRQLEGIGGSAWLAPKCRPWVRTLIVTFQKGTATVRSGWRYDLGAGRRPGCDYLAPPPTSSRAPSLPGIEMRETGGPSPLHSAAKVCNCCGLSVRAAGQHSIGRSAWLVVVVRQAFQKMISFDYQCLRPRLAAHVQGYLFACDRLFPCPDLRSLWLVCRDP
jgi:hypothetical protein